MVCKYFGVCGGCQNQHLTYEQQLANKKHRLQYLLQLYYKQDIPVHAGSEYGYRNRMDFITDRDVVGFRQIDERKLVDVEECPISEKRVNDLLTEVRRWLRMHPELETFDKQRKAGVLKYSVIRAADDSCVSFVLNEDSAKLAAHVEALRSFAADTTADNVVVAYVPADKDESTSEECFALKGQLLLTATLCGKKLQYHSQGFFQNNSFMAEQLVLHCRTLLQNYGGSVLVDAYAGVGTFGIPLADCCSQVISVESYGLSSEACAANIIANEVANMKAVNEPAEHLSKLDIPQDAVYLLDPPRSGLSEKVLAHLLSAKPRAIIYVSCNPSQLAKELVQLSQLYRVAKVDLFDLFPQTNHMETVALLERI